MMLKKRGMVLAFRGVVVAVAAAVLAYLPAGAGAQSNRWLPYEGHVNVHVAVDHNGLSMTRGMFNAVTGELMLDPAKPEAAQVSVRIEASSFYSGHAYRDNGVRSDWFLNSRKHRWIDFKSTKIERTGDKTAKMTGDLTLLGVTKPVTLDVTLNKKGKRPSGEDNYGFTAKGAFNRLDWGMNGFSRLSPPAITGEVVHLEIDAEFVRQK